MQTIRTDSVIVKDRIRKDYGDLTSLKESIAFNGLLHPIVVNSRMELIVGGRRLEALKQLGKDQIDVIVTDHFDEIAKALKAEGDENTCRLDLSVSEKLALADRLLPYEKAAAKERQKEHGGTTHGRPKVTCDTLPQVTSAPKSKDRVAEAVGWSRASLERAKKIQEATTSPNPDEAKFASDLMDEMEKTGKVSGSYTKLKEFQSSSVRDSGTDVVAKSLNSQTKFDKWITGLKTIRREIETFSKNKEPGSAFVGPKKIREIIFHAEKLLEEAKPFARCKCGHVCVECNDSGYVNKKRAQLQKETCDV